MVKGRKADLDRGGYAKGARGKDLAAVREDWGRPRAPRAKGARRGSLRDSAGADPRGGIEGMVGKGGKGGKEAMDAVECLLVDAQPWWVVRLVR